MIIDNPRAEHLTALRRIWQQAFGDSDSFLDSFFETGFAFERCRCIFSNGSPVAAVYLFDGMWGSRKAAYLYALAVEEAHRGQGLSRLLLTDTHGMLRREGYGIAVLEAASEPLRAYYERMGYRLFGSRQEKTVCQGREAAACSRLGCLGYEEKRRQLLPPGSITQEGALTEFLQTQAELWGGDGFVAALSRQEPVVLEFLGDVKKLPGFLKARKLPKATVRMTGGTPSSMYLSLDGTSEAPAYFGLPMD